MRVVAGCPRHTPLHAHDGAIDPFDTLIGDDEPIVWPAFHEGASEPCPPLPITQPGWLPNSVLASPTVVSAPLPQAVVTGLFMLGGNWFITRLWKKRKI